MQLTGWESQGWWSRKNCSSLSRETSPGIVALIPGRAIKTSLGFGLASGAAATVGVAGVLCSAAWSLAAGSLVSRGALVIALRGAACFLLRG